MQMKQETEFTSYSEDFSYEDIEKIWNAVQAVGKRCKVTIHQTRYNERPYGLSVTTEITVSPSA